MARGGVAKRSRDSSRPIRIYVVQPTLYTTTVVPRDRPTTVCFWRLVYTEAVRCPSLRAPAKTSLDCITHPVSGGSEVVRCELSCRGSSRFSAASVDGHWTTATQCGAHTGYRWTHRLQNVSLLACSGISARMLLFLCFNRTANIIQLKIHQSQPNIYTLF